MPAPDHTAVRVALWRALHVEFDPPPHVLEDTLGLQLAAPADDWRARPDMDPQRTARFRASIVARARFTEDLVEELAAQYVILGAGLDTFAQRKPQLASRIGVFEVDRAETQEWKRERLRELALPEPNFVPVDFETDWWPRVASSFDARKPALVSSMGVSMYLTREAIEAMLRHVASLARGSTFVMTFMLPLELVEPDVRPGYEWAMKGAAAAGTPFLSLFAPDAIVAIARAAGFRDVRHVSAADLNARYFAGRTDGLRTTRGEELIVATV